MNNSTWQRVKEIFDEARALTADDRVAYLDRMCADDAELRTQVDKLLNSYDSDFLEGTVLGAARILVEPHLRSGEIIGRYRIKELIGTGGMGQVFQADDIELDRPVAFKVLHRDVADDGERVRRFIQEAKAASALNHPNILTIHEIGSFEGARFIVSEYIDGDTLRDKMGAGLTAAESIEIACQVAAALQAAHSAGIIHRDIKPENLMIRRDGLVKVLDFGLAKLTELDDRPIDANAPPSRVHTSPGLVMGTVAYMSPEQARGQAVDARADLWSLGVVLHEMLTGKSPFEGESVTELVSSILSADSTPANLDSLPPELTPICQKALTRDKEKRYQSAHDLLEDLKGEQKRMEYAIHSTPLISAISADELKTQLIRPKPTLSAEYVVTTVKRHKYATLLATALTITIGVGLSVYNFQGATPGSTDNLAIIDESTKETDLKFERLPISGQTSDVAISPDGRHVAYIEPAPQRGIKLMQIDNSSTSTVVPQPPGAFVFSPTFSPDGKYMYYHQSTSAFTAKLMRVLSTGGPAQEIAPSAAYFTVAAFTPDGATLLFVREAKESGKDISEIVSAKLDGSDLRSVGKTQPGDFISNSLSISPDGKTVACQLQVKEGDARYVKIVGYDIASGAQRPLSDKNWGNTFGLVWLANGNLLVAGYERSSQTQRTPQLWLVTQDGRSKAITSGLVGYNRLSATRSSDIILTQQVRNANDLWVLPNNDPARARQVTTSGELRGGFAATPDGRIIMGSNVTGTLNLWMLNADGSERKQLTREGTLNTGPLVTPDGKYIVFSSDRAGTSMRLFRMDINGENAEQLTDDPGIRPRLSGDGKWAYYFETPQPSFEMFDLIKKVPINGGVPKVVAKPPDGWKFHSFDVNPANGRIAVGLLRMENDRFVYRAGIIRKEGEAVTNIIDLPANLNAGAVHWMPDNRNIATLGKDEPGPSQVVDVWKVPLSKTGRPTRLTNFRTPVTNNFNWSFDGKFMLVGHTKQMSEPVIIRISAQ